MKSPEKERVNGSRRTIAFALLALAIFIFAWQGGVSAVLTHLKYTFLEPANGPVGERSQVGGRDWAFLYCLSLAWFIPLTALFMIAFPDQSWLRAMHLVVALVLLIFFLAIMVIWAIDLHDTNKQSAINVLNIFNDPRWCLVSANRALAPGTCTNLVDSVPPVTQDKLGTNVAAAYVFGLLVVFLIFLLIDVLYTWLVFNAYMREYEMSKKPPMTDAEAPSQASEVEDVYEKPPPPPPPSGVFQAAKLSLPIRYKKAN